MAANWATSSPILLFFFMFIVIPHHKTTSFAVNQATSPKVQVQKGSSRVLPDNDQGGVKGVVIIHPPSPPLSPENRSGRRWRPPLPWRKKRMFYAGAHEVPSGPNPGDTRPSYQ